MGISHGGGDVFMAKQILDGANVISVFEKVCGEGMTERMTGHFFLNTRLVNGGFYFSCYVCVREMITMAQS